MVADGLRADHGDEVEEKKAEERMVLLHVAFHKRSGRVGLPRIALSPLLNRAVGLFRSKSACHADIKMAAWQNGRMSNGP